MGALKVKREIFLPGPAGPDDYCQLLLDQTKNGRGGCSNGFWEIWFAKQSLVGKSSNFDGTIKTTFFAAGGNSSFSVSEANSFFCCVFLVAAMALHKGQRCWPSNVSETAWEKDSLPRLAASIVVQATVCSAAQCSPVERTKAAMTIILPGRENTKAT